MMLLIDGNNMAYRALHTFSLSYKGQDVSVMYGMLHMLTSLAKHYNPSSVVVCFDGGTPPFRRRLWPPYKAHRIKDSDIDWDNIFWQLLTMRQIALPYHGVKVLWGSQIEADDLIAQMARLSTEPVIIVSTDDDLLQCISSKTKVHNPSKNKTYTVDNFGAEKGVPYWTWLLYKALVGDSSDGVAGIPSIGPKTATRIVEYVEIIGDVDWTDMLNLQSITREKSGIGRHQYQAICDTSQDDWKAMIDVMDLSHDYVGARCAIAQSGPWTRPSAKLIKAFLYKYRFVSLMKQEYYGLWCRMCMPSISWRDARAPCIYNRTPSC